MAVMLLALAPGLVRAQSSGPADLVIVRQGRDVVAYAHNRLGGPVEVELVATELSGMDSDVALPLRRVLPAHQRVPLARLTPHAAGGRQALQLTATPGEPYRVARDVVYSLPVDEARFELGQGFHGGFSHQDEANRYAVDLIVSEGTAVLAARDGVVMQAEARFASGGLRSTDDTARANFVRILHEDGTMALYAHLAPGGTSVAAGDRVRRGQRIGTSGNTGFSGGPHLHFVLQANRGMRLEAIPFKMFGPGGILRFTEAEAAGGVD